MLLTSVDFLSCKLAIPTSEIWVEVRHLSAAPCCSSEVLSHGVRKGEEDSSSNVRSSISNTICHVGFSWSQMEIKSCVEISSVFIINPEMAGVFVWITLLKTRTRTNYLWNHAIFFFFFWCDMLPSRPTSLWLSQMNKHIATYISKGSKMVLLKE